MYGIKANIRAPHRFMRMGALCWVVNTNPGSGGEQLEVVGLSRSGRTVRTWINARDLTNFRFGWTHCPERHLHTTRDEVEKIAQQLQKWWGVQPVRPHAAAFGRETGSGERTVKPAPALGNLALEAIRAAVKKVMGAP